MINGGNTSTRSGLLLGFLIGMVTGLVIAGGLAWYITKSGNPFVNTTQRPQVNLQADPPRQPAQEGTTTTADDRHSEFYNVLPDGKNPDPVVNQSVATDVNKSPKQTFYLQAGAFSDANEADKLKARLAMLGEESAVLDATLPDKTTVHRVRLGPFASADEMNKAATLLKQNGIDTAPVRP
jgi:cell division protein FtsN